MEEVVAVVKPKTLQVNTSSSLGVIWLIGWLFTIAFAKLVWWKAILGLLLWPYYLGIVVR